MKFKIGDVIIWKKANEIFDAIEEQRVVVDIEEKKYVLNRLDNRWLKPRKFHHSYVENNYEYECVVNAPLYKIMSEN